jgi:hypothetical protein
MPKVNPNNELVVRPFDFGTDAIERIRVSNPKSMIDADFEYGLQPTKWASYGLNRGMASILELQSNDLVVISATSDNVATSTTNSLITVVLAGATTGIAAGQPIHVANTLTSATGAGAADGGFLVASATVATNTTITYRAKGVVATANIFADGMVVRRCVFASGSQFSVTAPATATGGSAVSITTSVPHGFVAGTPIIVRGSSLAGTNPEILEGAYFVQSVTSDTVFTYTCRTGAGNASGVTGNLIITTDSDGLAAPRPPDGGVQIYTASASHGASIIRSTKKYNRYQSGKGYLWSSGTLFRPNYDIRSITSSGTTVTVTVDGVPHGLQVGAQVTIQGIATAGYSGIFDVTQVDSPYIFRYTALSTPAATPGVTVPGQEAKVVVSRWDGSVVRAGAFDDQNGMFFEYDGNTFFAVRRNATTQIVGTVDVTSGSSNIVGNSTRFLQQLRVGDKVVIKGMTYTIVRVTSDTAAVISPIYRGTTLTGVNNSVRASVVRETRIPQSQWNIDTCDGNGPSGFNLDLNLMQMVGIQYTWYGAGFVDWMIRGADGNWVMVHRLRNNNVNYEAHMRSGNLPVRYSVENESAYTYLTAPCSSSQTTITVADTSRFPNSGILLVDNEFMAYTSKTPTSFNLAVAFGSVTARGASLIKFQGGASRTFTSTAAIHNSPTATANNGAGVVLVRNTCSPSLVHWGSALLMDGGFDSDRGYIFNYQRAGLSLTTTRTTAFLLRLAPSVSAGLVGNIGVRDLINRAQFLLDAIGVDLDTATGAGAVIIEGVVNPTNIASATWVDVNSTALGSQPSFAQAATTFTFSSGTSASGGEQIFAFAGPAPSGAAAGGAVNDRLDLTPLKELTNSPIGGNGVYPDGPEVLAVNIVLRAGTATGTVLLRWSEAQA